MNKFMLLAMSTAFLFNQAGDGGSGQGGQGAGGAGSGAGDAGKGGDAGAQGGQGGGAGAGSPTDMSFIPEALRGEGWVNKYKTPDEFWKGVDSTIKLVGQKQIVQGIELPGEKATEEDWAKFHKAIGRPETADKYTFSEGLQAPEGFDLDEEKKGFSEAAFKHGLSVKQADGLFKEFLSNIGTRFAASQQQAQLKFDEAVVKAFGNDHKASLDLMKKGAKALSDSDNITLEEVTNPVALKALAKLGEYVGEDSLHGGTGDTSSKETLLEEAKRLQKSADYWTNPASQRRVSEIFKKVYPN